MKRLLAILLLVCAISAHADTFLTAGNQFVIVASTPIPPPPLLPPEPISPTPAIDLNFVANTYTGCSTLAACISLTRAAPETCYWQGVFPSVTYAPANTGCLTDYGWGSTYQASTNMLLWSQDISNAVWTHPNITVVPNAAAAPDGTITSNHLTVTPTFTTHILGQTKTAVAGTTYFYQGVGRSGANGRYVQLNLSSTSGPYQYISFDLTTCTIVGTGAFFAPDTTINLGVGGVQPLGGGDCRFWIGPVTAPANGTLFNFLSIIPFPTMFAATNCASGCYLGTGQDVYIWSLQLEASSDVTPYIPTTTTTVTRDADVGTVVPSSPLDNLLRGTQGYLVANPDVISAARGYVMSRNGTTDAFLTPLTSETLSARVAGTSVATAALGSLPLMNSGAVANLGVGWNSSSVKTVGNGGAVITSSTPFGAPGGTLYFGSADGTQGFLNMDVRRLFAGTSDPSDATLQALAPFQGTPFPPSTVAYFFSGTGSDSNDCMASVTSGSHGPCQTIAKLNSLSLGAGNTVSLDAATPFVGCIVLNRTNIPISIPGLPIIIGGYNGSQWTLTSDCTDVGNVGNGAITISGVNGITVQDCILRQGGGVVTHGGVFINTVSVVQTGDTVQRCDISGFQGTQTDGVGDVYVVASGGGGVDQLHLLNNTFHGASGPSDRENNGVQGFGIANSLGGNITNQLNQGNLIFNIGGTSNVSGGSAGFTGNCIGHSSHTGPTDQFNLCHDSGGNSQSCGGPISFEFFQTGTGIIQFNEAYNQNFLSFTGGACDNHPIDFDISVANSIAQDNYTHQNAGGWLFFGTNNSSAPSWTNNTARYNISENDNLVSVNNGQSSGSIVFVFGYGLHGQLAYNNTLYQNGLNTASLIVWAFSYNSGTTGTGLVANNIFVHNNAGANTFLWNDNGGGSNIGPGWIFKNNDYRLMTGGSTAFWRFFTNATTLGGWQTLMASNGGDTGASIADPALTSAGGGGTLTWTPATQAGLGTWPPATNQPSAYVLGGGSPMKSAGIDVSTLGFGITNATRDYYANITPGPGSCWNIGADGSCP